MNGPRIDILDPTTQDKIRRGPHAYVAGEGVHGRYVPLEDGYKHQEYPKMMDRTPAPKRNDFKSDAEYGQAFADWDHATTRSIVRSKEEEEAYLAAHPVEAAPVEKKGKAAR